MKYSVICLIMVGFVGFALISYGTANALLAAMSLEDLAETSEFVVVGEVIQISPTIPDYQLPFVDGYDRFLYDVVISVETDIDNAYQEDTITLRIKASRQTWIMSDWIEDGQDFKVGENVLVFIGKKEPESVMGDGYLVAGVTQGKYLLEGQKAYGTHYPEGIAVDELISKIQDLRQDRDFRYPTPGSGIIAHTLPIKKQFEAGLSLDQLRCKKDLELVIKFDRSPGCVKPETKIRLIERGWAQQLGGIEKLGMVQPELVPVKITNTTAFQICDILEIPCPSQPSFDAFFNSQTNTTTFEYFIKLHKYDFTIDDKRICYTVDGLDYQECPRLKAVIPSTLDGNNSLLLSKTLDEWTQMPEEELWPYYEKYGDDFFTEIGKFLIKNEMKNELERKNIVNKYDDFTVFAGGMLTSLPPHIGYQAVVNATDGKSYLLGGSTYSNTITSIVSEELVFYNVLEELPIDSLFTQEPLVTILPEDGNKERSDPHDLVIYLEKNNSVTFYNSMSVPVRVQESGSGKVEDEDNLKWKTPIIGPNQTATVSFNATGHYEWDARFPPANILSDWWESHTGGDISVISYETSNLEFQEKLRIAGSIVKNSEIPWTGLGMGNNRGLTIDFNSAIFHMLPDATEYYTARAHQLIPFDVPVIIEVPEIELQ